MKQLPAIPLSKAWASTRGVDWFNDDFDLRKAFLCAIFSELVYREIPLVEVGNMRRMWMIPCRAYQLLATGEAKGADLTETLREMEAFETDQFVLGTENVVTVGVKWQGIIIVAFRGTANFYDVIIDLLFKPHRPDARGTPRQRFHSGFHLEAQRCFTDIRTRLIAWRSPQVPVYLTGHSLGGAIAGVIMALKDNAVAAGETSLITSAYTFGMPRYGNKTVAHEMTIPFPIIRPKDPVPWLPPKIVGYEDCLREFSTAGAQVKKGAVDNFFSRFLYRNHYIERYRRDLEAHF